MWLGNLLPRALRAIGTVVPADGCSDARSQAMNTISTSLLVAACIFSGGVGGLYLHRFLPREHLTWETLDVIKLATGMLSVLASLVLGLLIATAKTSHDSTDLAIRNYAAELALLKQVRGSIRALKPVDKEQHALQDGAVGIHMNLLRQRWLLIEQQGPSVQRVVLVVLVSWVTVIFVSFGLNAPRNGVGALG